MEGGTVMPPAWEAGMMEGTEHLSTSHHSHPMHHLFLIPFIINCLIISLLIYALYRLMSVLSAYFVFYANCEKKFDSSYFAYSSMMQRFLKIPVVFYIYFLE